MFGVLVTGQLYCDDARQLAANALRRYRPSMSQSSFLCTSVLPAIWAELARPAALREVHGGGQLSDESSRFWLLAPSLRAATTDEVQKQITTDEQVDEARRRLHGWDLSRRLDLS